MRGLVAAMAAHALSLSALAATATPSSGVLQSRSSGVTVRGSNPKSLASVSGKRPLTVLVVTKKVVAVLKGNSAVDSRGLNDFRTISGSRVFMRSGKASCQLDAESSLVTPWARKVVTEERNVVVGATAEVAPIEADSAAEAPADGISTLLSEREMLKRKAKRAELRRKRLVRKRKLRKKGKWPPSKMAKLKNV